MSACRAIADQGNEPGHYRIWTHYGPSQPGDNQRENDHEGEQLA
jgi:hypothetical protein